MSEHDDLRFDGDDLDAGERILAARLTSAMALQAGTIVLADEPFDPSRPTADLGGEAPATARRLRGVEDAALAEPDGIDPVTLEPLPIASPGAPRPGWVVWAAGAAAAAVLIAAIVAINAVRQPTVRTGEETAPLVGPDAAWAPTWVPDGFELWSLDVGFGDPRSIIAGVSTDDLPVSVVQLLESSTSDAKVLVNIAPDGQLLDRGTPITVRGVAGTTMPEQLMGPGSPTATSLEWAEGGSAIGALAVGLDEPAAVALLDGLVLTDGSDPSSGFAAPSDGTWTVRTDDPRAQPETDVVVGSFGYAQGRPTDGRLPLQVVTYGSGSPVSGVPGYLVTAFLGAMGDDGVARSFSAASGDRPAQSYTVWPDGRTVYSAGTELDEATASRIAESIEPLTRAELERRADEVSAKLGSAAVLAKVDLPSGTVEVIGDGEPSAICLTAAGRRTCRTSESMTGGDATLMGSVVIDGTWYVFAASDDGPVELGVGMSGSMVGSGTAVATTIASDDEVSVDPSMPVPTIEGPPIDVEVITSEVPAGPGPGSSTSLPTSGSTFDGGMTTGTGPPDRSVPFESAVVGSWTLALLVAPADADAAWASFTNNMITFPRPSA